MFGSSKKFRDGERVSRVELRERKGKKKEKKRETEKETESTYDACEICDCSDGEVLLPVLLSALCVVV